ncbi:small, acid-soluble spore protein K [Desertibacillus haloalkaliphilus]|nr:small, acid-soluble spore protein K [Desertibacillus haloalkaliphilus]MBU8908872.1 small, acid-soluble spore protein K [Desertibacillus haloalkaliphilus]
MRNKEKGFPNRISFSDPRARAEYSSKRANGTIQTQPQERMNHANHHREQ